MKPKDDSEKQQATFLKLTSCFDSLVQSIPDVASIHFSYLINSSYSNLLICNVFVSVSTCA